MAGDETAVENSFINLWDNEYENSGNSLAVMDYLRYGLHPRFLYTPDAMTDGYTQQIITPASLISGVELPILMGCHVNQLVDLHLLLLRSLVEMCFQTIW